MCIFINLKVEDWTKILLILLTFWVLHKDDEDKMDFRRGGGGRGWGGIGASPGSLWGHRYGRGGYPRYRGYGLNYGLGYGPTYGVSPTYEVNYNVVPAKPVCFSELSDGIHYYYTDWCGYCKRFKPIWEKTKSKLGKSISFQSHNGETSNTDCVEGYPTIVAKRNGIISKYDGSPDSKLFHDFVMRVFG